MRDRFWGAFWKMQGLMDTSGNDAGVCPNARDAVGICISQCLTKHVKMHATRIMGFGWQSRSHARVINQIALTQIKLADMVFMK